FSLNSFRLSLQEVHSSRKTANVATMERDNKRRLMLLQTLRTHDFDELAQAFPQWDLRFRQLGRGTFEGQLQFLHLGGIQVFRLPVNGMSHAEGWPPPSSFGCFPVLAENANAVWSGRHLKAGQVRLGKPGLVADHLTAADHYQLVGLALDADLVRQELPVLG